MSIRATFQANVDEFISNLEEFATGSYLRPEEREFWDQPFDPKVLPSLRQILEGFLDRLDNLPAPVESDAVTEVVTDTITAIDNFNTKHADAVVEPEERQELNEFIRQAVAATEVDEDALAGLPELE